MTVKVETSLEEFDTKMKEISEAGLDLTVADEKTTKFEQKKHSEFVQYDRAIKHEYEKENKKLQKAATKEGNPEVPPEGCYFDKQGATRDLVNKRLVKGTKAMNPRGRPRTGTIEDYVKLKLGRNGEDIVNFLKSVMDYNQTKKRHKFAWYTAANKIEAAKLLLRIAFENKTEQPDKVVNIMINLPKGLNIKDI